MRTDIEYDWDCTTLKEQRLKEQLAESKAREAALQESNDNWKEWFEQVQKDLSKLKQRYSLERGDCIKLKRELAAKDAEIAALTAQVESNLATDIKQMHNDLLSAQATNKKLREALIGCERAMRMMLEGGEWYAPEDKLFKANEALALPTSDQALFEFGMRVGRTMLDREVERVREVEDIVREVMGKCST